MTEQAQGKIDFGQQVLKEINEPTPEGETHKRSFWSTISIPLLAILTGLIIGAILIAATSPTVWAAFSESIWQGFGQAFTEIGKAYGALFTGSIADPAKIVNAISTGDLFRKFSPSHSLYFFGVGSRCRLSQRVVQHRRGRPAFHWRRLCHVCRLCRHWSTCLYSYAPRVPCRSAGRCNLGFYPRVTKG